MRPKRPPHGRRIAAPKPGWTTATGFSNTIRSPFAELTPALAPPAKPMLLGSLISLAFGASCPSSSERPSSEALSTTMKLVAQVQLGGQARQRPTQIRDRVMRDDNRSQRRQSHRPPR